MTLSTTTPPTNLAYLRIRPLFKNLEILLLIVNLKRRLNKIQVQARKRRFGLKSLIYTYANRKGIAITLKVIITQTWPWVKKDVSRAFNGG